MRRYLALTFFVLVFLKFPWNFMNDGIGHFIPQSKMVQSTIQTPPLLSTPVSSSNSSTVRPIQKPTKTPRIMPSHTPRPTLTPPEIPPPTDQRLLHSMILFGVIACLTVLIGLWINRKRIHLR